MEYFSHSHCKYTGIRGMVKLYEDALRYRYMITDEAQRRLRILAFAERHGKAAAHDAFGVSSRTLFRWRQSLVKGGGRVESLNPLSREPRRKRRRAPRPVIEDRIVALRREHPRIGKDKLHSLLVPEGFTESVSTIGRLLGDLKKKGKLPDPRRLSLLARTGTMMERKSRKLRKKLRRPPGYRVLEIDTVVRFLDGTKRYLVTAADTEKRTAFAAAYTNHGSASAADFLSKAVAVLPDCPSSLQTDNGSEFALHFDQAASQLGLTHFHTYPRSPKMNAHVERFNRTLDEEFLSYHRDLLRDNVRAFNEKLVEWLLWYNAERPHAALGQISPFRYILSTLPASECQMWWTHTNS